MPKACICCLWSLKKCLTYVNQFKPVHGDSDQQH
ncbi:unnamed protein product [Oncorhynchus mykiss]|uniref:Uncharacterized protein n=1 Tax=Oncorhynchus mykiss TaxID=8022 RepID=A0A060YHT3_ONCMY|nr:unnamed protein product [Oncorhynchus mykiss]